MCGCNRHRRSSGRGTSVSTSHATTDSQLKRHPKHFNRVRPSTPYGAMGWLETQYSLNRVTSLPSSGSVLLDSTVCMKSHRPKGEPTSASPSAGSSFMEIISQYGPHLCAAPMLDVVRGKQFALPFQLFLLSGVEICDLRRICGHVRAIITDNSAEALIGDGRSLFEEHYRAVALETSRTILKRAAVSFQYEGARLEAHHRQYDQLQHVSALLAADQSCLVFLPPANEVGAFLCSSRRGRSSRCCSGAPQYVSVL